MRPSVMVVTFSAGTYFGLATRRRDLQAVEDVGALVPGTSATVPNSLPSAA